MNQRFRRNFAPVLGALALLVLGIGAWALTGAYRTQEMTAALHAQLAPGASPWGFQPADDGYAVFVYRGGERVCATLSLQPQAATLVGPQGEPRTLARAQVASLLADVASLAQDCDTLEVLVFASRMPYHGRFSLRYDASGVLERGEPEFGMSTD